MAKSIFAPYLLLLTKSAMDILPRMELRGAPVSTVSSRVISYLWT